MTLKEKLPGRKFNIISEVILAVHDALKQLPEKVILVLKGGLKIGTVAYHLREGCLKKKKIYFFL